MSRFATIGQLQHENGETRMTKLEGITND